MSLKSQRYENSYLIRFNWSSSNHVITIDCPLEPNNFLRRVWTSTRRVFGCESIKTLWYKLVKKSKIQKSSFYLISTTNACTINTINKVVVQANITALPLLSALWFPSFIKTEGEVFTPLNCSIVWAMTWLHQISSETFKTLQMLRNTGQHKHKPVQSDRHMNCSSIECNLVKSVQN